jgi:DNA-binding transcriptional LysR family regulator
LNFRSRVPSLTALTAFEAAARLASFTKAAAELGVSQAAVSRQVGSLEDNLGFPLFRRGHRSVVLTEKGRQLSDTMTTTFQMISDTVLAISGDDDERNVSISATVAFSHFWLIPRLSSFSRLHPDVKIRIVTYDRPEDIVGTDVAIRFGSGLWPDGSAHLLFRDEIFPVCSPEFLSGGRPVETVADIGRHSLISYDADDPSWTGWREWFARFGVPFQEKSIGLRCSFYTDVVYGALNGQGIALGWKRLVSDLLDQNRLVRITDAVVTPRSGYFVTTARGHSKEGALLFIEWLRGIAEQDA